MAESNGAHDEITEFKAEIGDDGRGTADSKEETVVKIKLLEEPVSLQVPVEERSMEEDSAFNAADPEAGEKGETSVNQIPKEEEEEEGEEKDKERRSKEAARKEKRKKRREKRKERAKSEESDGNNDNQESALEEKKAKMEGEEDQDCKPEKDQDEAGESEEKPVQEEHDTNSVEEPEIGEVESEKVKVKPMEEPSLKLSLVENPFVLKAKGNEEPGEEEDIKEVDIQVDVYSERKESVAMEVKALLEANMDGVAENDPDEELAKDERERRAAEVLASMSFENDQEAGKSESSDAETPRPQEPVEEFFMASEATKGNIQLELLPLEDSDDERSPQVEETQLSEEDKDAKLEELFRSSENAISSFENDQEAGKSESSGETQPQEPIEEFLIASETKKENTQLELLPLEDSDDERSPQVEEIQLSEEDKDAKLEELFRSSENAISSFENDQEAGKSESSGETQPQEPIEEFLIASETKKENTQLELLPLEDSDDERSPQVEEIQLSEQDKDAKLEELFSCHDAAENDEEKESGTTEDRETVEEVFVAHFQKKVEVQPQVWQLAKDDDEVADPNGENEEQTEPSEEEKEAKLKELFEEKTEEDPKQEDSLEAKELEAQEVEEHITADSEEKIEAELDWSALDDDESVELTQDSSNDSSPEEVEKVPQEAESVGVKDVSADASQAENTEETDPFSEVRESVEEYVSVPERKIDLCLEALSSGEQMSDDENSAQEPTTVKESPKDFDSLFEVHPEQEVEKEDEDEREEVLDFVVMTQKTPDVLFHQFPLETFLDSQEEAREKEKIQEEESVPTEEPDEVEEITEEGEEECLVLGEVVQEEIIKEETKVVNVECAWDMSVLDKEKNVDEEPGEGGVEEVKNQNAPGTSEDISLAETKTTEAVSREKHVEISVQSKTTFTTSLTIKPVSPTLKKAPEIKNEGTPKAKTEEAVTHSSVTTTLETIMVTKATSQDSKTNELAQVVLRQNLKKDLEKALEPPLPDKESEGTAPLAQIEGTGLEGSKDDLLDRPEKGTEAGSDKEPLIEKAPAEEEPSEKGAEAQDEEPEVEIKKQEVPDEEQLIPEEDHESEEPRLAKHRPKCCVLL